MMTDVLTIEAKKRVRVRGIALPNEHGSWGGVLEPLAAALAIAPSIGAVWISLLVVGAFLSRRPLMILLANRRAKRDLPQNPVALKFVLLYGAIFWIGLAGGLIYLPIETFIPFALIIPLAGYQIYCDVSRQSRRLLPELTGAVAISSAAAAIALAGGWKFAAAFALWGVFIARLIPAIVYVRNRLRLEKGREFLMLPVIAIHFIAFGAVGMLSAYGLASKLTLAVFIILLGRAFFGMSPYRRRMRALQIGIWEVIYGSLLVLAVVFGHYLQI